MIAESHVSLHVFPHEERAYFDLFSCRFFDRNFRHAPAAGPVPRRQRSGKPDRPGKPVTGTSGPSGLTSTPSHAPGSLSDRSDHDRRPPFEDPKACPRTDDRGRRPPGSVLALLGRMSKSAFQGRKLGEAFDAWKRMIEGDSVICLGYAASMSSAGMWPLVTWLVGARLRRRPGVDLGQHHRGPART